MKNKFLAVALSAAMALSVFPLYACDTHKDKELAYVSLDINPSIELIVDKDNKVVSVRGENEDGQVLLYGETGIEGEKIDAAVDKITDLAVKYGYLDEDNKVVDTLVSSADASFADEILSKITASVTATAANSGLTVKTDGAGAYSLLRKMEQFKKQHPDNPAVQNMSISKFKLALSVSETGEISLEAAAELDDGKLIEMLKEASLKIEKFATAAYTQAKQIALVTYDQITEIAGYAAYSAYYLEKMLSHPTTVYYGAVYQMYATAAKALDAICNIIELGTKAKNMPLNGEQIAAVEAALGLTSSEEIENKDGEVTLESIEAYADKLFKNSPASDALEQVKAALDGVLTETETFLSEKAKQIAEEYKPQIDQVVSSAQQAVSAIEKLLPEGVKTELGQAIADYKEIAAAIKAALTDGQLDIDELRQFAKNFSDKAQTYFDKMKNDLSDEEWAEIQAKKDELTEVMSAQKQALEKGLAEAEKQAKEYLENLKAERVK